SPPLTRSATTVCHDAFRVFPRSGCGHFHCELPQFRLRQGTSQNQSLRRDVEKCSRENEREWGQIPGMDECCNERKGPRRIRSTWNSSFDTRKASGQLKNVDEKQAAKLTENVAEEVVKNSTKWRFVKKALVITFGVGIAALIVVGIDAMAS
ncbi:hypothetical protein JG687_00015985, partial [Phytophthora cactorum]